MVWRCVLMRLLHVSVMCSSALRFVSLYEEREDAGGGGEEEESHLAGEIDLCPVAS